jgi:glycine cleavage system H protein
MSSYPTDLLYTENHQWVRTRDNVLTVGITEFAAAKLGPIGFVGLPFPGELFRPGSYLGRLSSDNDALTVSMPFIGQLNEVNQALEESPGLINSDPYGDGWIVVVEPGDAAAVARLMDAEAYEAFVTANGE